MTYTCSQCGLQYGRLWSLNRHCLTSHNNKRPRLEPRPVSWQNEDEDRGSSSEDDVNNQSGGGVRQIKDDESSTDADNEDEGSSSEDDVSNQNGGGVHQIKDVSNTDALRADEGSDVADSEDAGSEIENWDEIDQDVNVESETETSESDEDEDDDIPMDEDETRSIPIKWPVSRTYRINNPWFFWGEMPRIKKHIRWLERLKDAEKPTVAYNIQNASNSQIAALCEIAYNCIWGYVPFERWNFNELRKQKRGVRLLANSEAHIEDKKHEIVRRGANFVEMLLYTIRPLLQFNIPRGLKVKRLVEESDEEVEESDEEVDDLKLQLV